VSLAGRLGTALLKRIEASPRVQAEMERRERTRPVTRAALRAAHSADDEETAKAKLREWLQTADPGAVNEALAHFGARDDYVRDRA
jgi:hypothetical protein